MRDGRRCCSHTGVAFATLFLRSLRALTSQTEKGDDELKDKSESEIFNTTGMSKNWFYFGVFIVVFSFLGTFYSQLTARSGGQGPPRN